MKMNQRGQMNTGIVWGVIIMLVSICIGGLVFGTLQKATETQAHGTGTTFTRELLNTSFTENTGLNADHWDNYKENGATASLDTSQDYFIVRSTENETATIDNGVLKQALTITTIYDELTSATTTFKYRVYDNDNSKSIVVRVLLDDGTDNHTLYLENVTLNESASWTTVENDVSAYVDGTGTYTLWLRAEMNGCGPASGGGTLSEVQFDDANLSVNVYSEGMAENIVEQTGAAGVSIFPLIILMVTVGVFVAIIAVLKYLG